MLQNFAAGHPKFGAEREVRASPCGLALTVCRLNAPRVPKKSFLQKKMLGTGQRQGFRWYERPGERHERTQAVCTEGVVGGPAFG